MLVLGYYKIAHFFEELLAKTSSSLRVLGEYKNYKKAHFK